MARHLTKHLESIVSQGRRGADGVFRFPPESRPVIERSIASLGGAAAQAAGIRDVLLLVSYFTAHRPNPEAAQFLLDLALASALELRLNHLLAEIFAFAPARPKVPAKERWEVVTYV